MSVYFCKQCQKKSYFVLTYQELLCAYCGSRSSLHNESPAQYQSDLLSDVVTSINNLLDLFEDKTACPKCGQTWDEFLSTARLGCSYDYEYFSERLKPILYKIHGTDKHKDSN